MVNIVEWDSGTGPLAGERYAPVISSQRPPAYGTSIVERARSRCFFANTTEGDIAIMIVRAAAWAVTACVGTIYVKREDSGPLRAV